MKKSLLVCLMALLSSVFSACNNQPKALSGEKIYSKLIQSTVEVNAESDYISSLGTGFYIDDTGTIVTNYHVIQDCSNAWITAADGNVYEVTGVVGYSEKLDIAILRTSQTNSIPVEVSTAVDTGETIYVLGSSLGLTGTFSEGLVSTAERELDGVSYIQISAPISHGNSGGPVVNAEGQVIGIASAGFEEGQNLNLALPISVLDQIPTTHILSMSMFYNKTSDYPFLFNKIVEQGSSVGVRVISCESSTFAEFVLESWKQSKVTTERSLIGVMNQYAADQGGGQLYIIDRGVFVEEIEEWCFAPERQPGDYAIIRNPYGYSICYYSIWNDLVG